MPVHDSARHQHAASSRQRGCARNTVVRYHTVGMTRVASRLTSSRVARSADGHQIANEFGLLFLLLRLLLQLRVQFASTSCRLGRQRRVPVGHDEADDAVARAIERAICAAHAVLRGAEDATAESPHEIARIDQQRVGSRWRLKRAPLPKQRID